MYNTQTTDIPLSRLSDPPRSVRLSKLGVGIRIFVWALTVVLVLISVGVSRAIIDTDQRLAHGARTTGTVVAKHVIAGSGDDSDSYYLDVRFSAGSRTVTESVNVGEGDYGGYKIGAPATITYVPGDEATCRLGVVTAQTVANDRNIAGLTLFLTFPVFVVIPLVIEVTLRRQLRLLRIGRATLATVERVSGPRKDGVRVTYGFEAQGVFWKGTTVYGVGNKRKPANGEQITVLYFPSRPKVNEAAANIHLAMLTRGSLRD